MLSYDPLERPNVSEILEHPWFKLQIPTKEEVDVEFNKRDKIVKHQKAIEAQEEEKKQNEIKAHEKKMALRNTRKTTNQRVYKDGNTGDSELISNIIEFLKPNESEEITQDSVIKNYVPGYNNFKFTVKDLKPSELLERLISYFDDDEGVKDKDKRKKIIKVNENEFELSVTYKHNKELLKSLPDLHLQELEIKAEIKIMENKELMCEFFKYKGDKMEFYDVYDNCLEYFNCTN